MDRNTIIGLVTIFLILIGFSYFNRPSQEQLELNKRRSDSIAHVKAEQQKNLLENPVTAQPANNQRAQVKESTNSLNSTVFAESTSGKERIITLENNLIRLKVSTLGGYIHSAEVKNFYTYSKEPLILFNKEKNNFGLQFWGNNINVETFKLFFTPNSTDTLIFVENGANAQSLTMRLVAGDSSYIDYVYTIHPESYLIDFDIQFSNMDKVISGNTNSIDLIWDVLLSQLEKNPKKEAEYTSIAYHLPNGDFEELNPRGETAKEEVKTKIKWIGYKQQFFSTFLVAEDNFLNANFNSVNVLENNHIKYFSSRIALPVDNLKNDKCNLKMYFGPNHFNTLKSYNYAFEDVVPLGGWLIGWINRYVIIFLFDILDNIIGSYGLIILLLTIIIKLALFPLTYKSYFSQAKMRVLKPQVDAINAKYPKKEDAMKKQQAVMGLYKKVGVSPLGGCLPMLIQFPFLIAMFRFFPASFELRQKSFLWAEDLSTYDSIVQLPIDIPFYGDHISLFTLLMAAALYFTSKLSADQMADTNAQMPGMKFMMLYMMPLMLVVWFNSYASGLSYYYFLANVITLGQTYLIRKTVNDGEILKKLNENAKKPQTKSKFQEKLEMMAKQQQNKRGK
jgi:YidC/Oxa1 family membrane protein insertase